jgi:hypothetical protein
VVDIFGDQFHSQLTHRSSGIERRCRGSFISDNASLHAT